MTRHSDRRNPSGADQRVSDAHRPSKQENPAILHPSSRPARRLTINRVALGSIRAHKRQYVSLTAGIMLAIFSISTLLMVVISIYYNALDDHFAQFGYQDAIIAEAPSDLTQDILASGIVADAGCVYVTGVSTDKLYTLGYMDDVAARLAPRTLLEGRLPEAAGEVAVEQSLLMRLRLDAQVGDAITLEYDVPTQDYYLPDAVAAEYTLVGIYRDMSATQNEFMPYDRLRSFQPAALISPAEGIAPGGYPIASYYIKYKPGVSDDEIGQFTDSTFSGPCWYVDQNYNSVILALTDSAILLLVTILGVALVVMAGIGIANAFAVNLAARRRQIGMMRALGATSRQLRRIYGREALVIALTTAPASVALAYGAAWGVLRLMDASLQLHVPPAFLPLNVVLSLICVMLAALAPLVDIGRISPMQAIRETSLLRSRRRIRLRRRREYDAARLLARRHIALYRSKRVGVTIVLALSLVIISGSCYVFETSNVPVDIQYDYTMSRLSGASTPFVDVDALWPGMNDSDIYDMRALPLVDGVYAEKCINATALVDDVTNYILDLEWSRFDISYLYDRSGQKHGAALALDMPYRIDENYQRQYDAMRSRLGVDAHMIPMDMVAIDPELVKLLNDCVYQGTIDLDALNSGREVLLFAPEYINIYLEKQGDNGFSSTTNYDVAPVIQPELRLHNDMFSAGDELRLCYLFATDPLGDDVDIESLSGVERRDATTRIGAILGKCNSVVQSYPDCPFAITTHAGLAALGLDVADYTDIGITLSTAPDLATLELLDSEIERISQRYADFSFYSANSSMHAQEDSRRLLIACACALIGMFFAIVASMVNNALTNRLRSDLSAIGTLRAVGAPLRTIYSSYRYQLIYMLGWGTALGIALSLGMYAILAASMWAAPTIANSILKSMLLVLPLALVFVGLLVLTGMACLWFRLRGVMRIGIVDSIREL